jgi:prepilin-type N-terminal cleavage/methylation domain-containing protein
MAGMKKPIGYTLVEMMIVVVIIAIGSAIAAASIIRARKNTLLTDASRETYNILQTARSTALLRNVAIGISIHKDASAAWMRLDESTTTSCASIAGVADPLRYGVMGMSFAEARWHRLGEVHVSMDQLVVDGAGVADALLCVNRTGRLLKSMGGGWTYVTGLPALEIRYQLYEGGSPVGVERILRMEQGGTVRIVR